MTFLTDDLQIAEPLLIDFKQPPYPRRGKTVLRGERRFCIRSTDDRIELLDAVASLSGEDRHEYIQRLIKEDILDTIQSDMTGFIPTPHMIKRINDVFS